MGGAILPEKSHWYLVDFKWENDTWWYATIEETPAELDVRDFTGQRKRMEHLAVHKAQRTLGVWLSPDGNSTLEIEYLLGKAKEWGNRIRTAHLPRHLVWESLQTTILKTLQYPTPATTLSKAQCDQILSPLLRAGLPRAGVLVGTSQESSFTALPSIKVWALPLFIPHKASNISNASSSLAHRRNT